MKKFKRIFAVFFCLLLASGILGGCGKAGSSSISAQSASQSGSKPLKIVTTIFPEYDWVREILGDKADNAEVSMLLDNGVDLHSYQPTADDIIKISDCDLFIYVGGESDGWVEDALKEATNKNMKVINLLDVLKDTVKTEEAMPGMQAEEGHHHGYSRFADSDVRDRSLSDWDGEWQSVYPYLQEGILDEVMERKAENGNKTAEEYRAYYETGYKTDVSKITINAENNTMCFVKNGVEAKATYQYKGYIRATRFMTINLAAEAYDISSRQPMVMLMLLSMCNSVIMALLRVKRNIFTFTSAMKASMHSLRKWSIGRLTIRWI